MPSRAASPSPEPWCSGCATTSASSRRAPRSKSLAKTVDDNGGVYFVPAFSGLFAPYWKATARGVIAGLTRYVNKGHIARAVLEATAFQTREVVDAMQQGLRHRAGRAAHRWRHGRKRSADAVPGRHSRQARCQTRSSRKPPRSALPTQPDWQSASTRTSTTCAPTGRSTRPGSRTWMHAKRESMYKLWKKAVTRTFDWVEETTQGRRARKRTRRRRKLTARSTL